MKTIRKVIALSLTTGISVFGFSQVNLGVQSATSAALHATANTAAVTQTTNAVAATTAGTVKATTAKTTSTVTTLISMQTSRASLPR